MEKIILDTDILIDLLRKEPKTTELIRSFERVNDLGTTDINAFELYWGAYKSRRTESELTSSRGLLKSLFLVNTNEAAMELAAKTIVDLEKRGNPIDLRDLFIGSICIANSYTLLTRNKKHFEKIKGIQLA